METVTPEPPPAPLRVVAGAAAGSRSGGIGSAADLVTSALTAREIAVLNGLAAGLSDREVALKLMVFEPSVKIALRSIYRKLRVSTRRDAAAYAIAKPARPS